MNNQFQNWLTITFATIVASFAARNKLSKKMKYLVTALYVLASLTCGSAYYYVVQENFELTILLVELGREESGPIMAGIFRTFLFVLGIVTTIFFIHKSDINDGT